jgi:glucan phosphoethanolaminetransferase (alkaline phosphatase superfamily)
MNKKLIVSTLLLLSPFFANAATSKNLRDLVYLITYYLNIALVLLMGVAVVIFVYNVIKYFIVTTEDHKGAGMYVLYSVIGFFVILSFWGLVNILQNTFELQNDENRPTSWASFSNIFPSSSSGNANSTPFVPSQNSIITPTTM